MRQLTKEEKELNQSAIKRFEERNKQLKEYFIPKTKLELTYGLPNSYQRTKDDYEHAINEWESEFKSNLNQIKILDNQNKLGVEEKNPKQNE